jgi:MATE family multidrug resistance protein
VLSVPVLISLVTEPIAGLVDTAFVTRLGAAPLAGLGIGASLVSSMLWTFSFLGIGTQTEVARALGTADRQSASERAGLAIAIAALSGIGIAIVFWPAAGALVHAMGATGDVRDAGYSYLSIRLLGAAPLLVMMCGFGALRGLHDMHTPLRIALVSGATNVVLDAVFIFGLGPFPALGVAGAAWATVASQWVGGVWSLHAVHRQLGLPRRIPWNETGRLFVVGRDMFLRTGLLIAFLLLTTRAANRIGAPAGAAHQIIRQTWICTALALDAYATTAQSLIAFFLGADRRDMARRAAGVASRWGFATGAFLCALMLGFESEVVRWLVPASAQDSFPLAWRVTAFAQPLNALSFVTDGIHWGARDYRFLRNVMLAATLSSGAVLLLADTTGYASLAVVWIITGGWITVRAAFGVLRVWPGIGAAPLGASPLRRASLQSPATPEIDPHRRLR